MKKDKELILSSYFQASDETMFWYKLANDQISQLSKSISSVVAFLIPLIGSIVFIQDKTLLTDQIKGLIMLVLVALIISLIFGYKQVTENTKYFNKFVKLNGDRARIYFNNLNADLNKLKKKDDKLDRPEKADNHWLQLQQITVFIALILVFVVIYQLLYR